MKCKMCGCERIVKNGFRRGKQCFLCKNEKCGHQFTSEIAKYSSIDKYIAQCLYSQNTRYKLINKFINSELRITHIAKILNCKYTTLYGWLNPFANLKVVKNKKLLTYLKNKTNGRDIYGLLFPDEVPFQPSKKLLEIIKHKK